ARTGQPIAGAKVRLQAVTLARMWAPLTLETDDDGQFSLDGAPTDMPFTVRAQAEGYNTRLVGGLTADDRAVAIQLNPAEGEARKEVPTTGIIMRKAREGLQVVRVDENSPGRDAGLMAGDVIVAIDGRPTREMTHVEGVQRLRGEPGTSVTLAYERNGTREKATVLRALRIE
ncbi:MAG: PDZ domain-containing protein, partial [Myxococcota bacterium]